ncbi:MAG: response regulator [Thermoplasmatota archaeon]
MAKARIMIVEDEEITALALRSSLERLGYAVVATPSSGEEAIHAAMTSHLDVIIMDIRLKGAMRGIEAAERIRRAVGTPVIYLTAYADEETLEAAKTAQPAGYLVKPFNLPELRSAITIAIHNKAIEEERKRAEAAIRLRESVLAQFVDSTPTAIAVKDTNGRFLFVNRAFEEERGVNRVDARGKTEAEIWPGPRSVRAESLDHAVLETGNDVTVIEAVPDAKDERDRVATRFALRDATGTILGVGCITSLASRGGETALIEDSRRQNEAVARQIALIGMSATDPAVTPPNGSG